MKKAFTLAEVLITLAIIGVVAAISIPSVVANTQQKEFQTGLRKAVSVLNSSITMNMALDGETPYDTKNLWGYLQRHMSVIRSTDWRPSTDTKGKKYANWSFYTTDGMEFEVPFSYSYDFAWNFPLYENPEIKLLQDVTKVGTFFNNKNCGSYGLINNQNNTTKPPCLVVVDVNGARKPSISNYSCDKAAFTSDSPCLKENVKKYSDPNGKKLTDIFSIMITESSAVPYGVAAQRAMYEAQTGTK